MKILKKPFALSNHFDKAVPGMVIFDVGLEMVGEAVDVFGKERYLNFAGAGVLAITLVIGNNVLLFFLL